MAEWFRRKTWQAEDRADFFARLKRTRSQRSQYLRIQALHLQETGEPELLHASLELLAMLLSEKKTNRHWIAAAHGQRAACLQSLGRHDEALAAYRDSFDAERAFPTVKTGAYRDFGDLVLALGRAELFDEVLGALKEFGGDEVFPLELYQVAVIRAFICEARGELVEAEAHARAALDAAARAESGFRFHKKLGLVGEQEADVEARLLKLVSQLH